jgi:predicted restriction endonuclease
MANHRIMADNDVQLQGSDTETGADSRAAEQSWSGTLHQPLHQSLGHAFQPQDSQEAQGRLLRAILVRKGQAQLRRTLLRAYGERCAISRCGVAQVLEVAYILPFSHHKTNHPSNTLLLRSDLHLLFDLHLLTIDPETLTVLIAPGLAHSCYGTMAGRTIYWPSVDEYEPDLEALAQHKALCAWHQQEESAWSEAYSF